MKEYKYRQKLAKRKLGIGYIEFRRFMGKNQISYSPMLESLRHNRNLIGSTPSLAQV